MECVRTNRSRTIDQKDQISGLGGAKEFNQYLYDHDLNEKILLLFQHKVENSLGYFFSEKKIGLSEKTFDWKISHISQLINISDSMIYHVVWRVHTRPGGRFALEETSTKP